LKSYLSSGKSLAMAISLLPMWFHHSRVSSARETRGSHGLILRLALSVKTRAGKGEQSDRN